MKITEEWFLHELMRYLYYIRSYLVITQEDREVNETNIYNNFCTHISFCGSKNKRFLFLYTTRKGEARNSLA